MWIMPPRRRSDVGEKEQKCGTFHDGDEDLIFDLTSLAQMAMTFVMETTEACSFRRGLCCPKGRACRGT